LHPSASSTSRGRGLIAPQGGALPDLHVEDPSRRAALRELAAAAPTLLLSERSQCDLELLADGAYAPLTGFLGREDHARVLDEMRLTDGTLWPLPITLPISGARAPGTVLALRDAERELLAVLTVGETYAVDLEREMRALWGEAAPEHPLREEFVAQGPWRVAGRLEVLRRPSPGAFAELRRTPRELRTRLDALGAARVVAFQTRNPMHGAHEWITKAALEEVGGTLLLHPTVGPTMPDDVDTATRLRAIAALHHAHFDPSRSLLAALPLPMWMAGPREALHHALVRRNYGADHLIVGRDHAGPGRTRSGAPFFPPEASQDLVGRHAAETGVAPVRFGEVVYLEAQARYERAERVPPHTRTLSLSGTEVRAHLAAGRPLPTWFTRPETAAVLAARHGPAAREGVCVWFTGLPAAGKSTLARALGARFEEAGRPVTMLDGDVVRSLLSKGLGFSREDRDANVARIAFVAAEVVRHGGVAIVAAVSPYGAARREARTRVGPARFLLVHVATPLEVCEVRDGKGVYAAGRAGHAHGVTGLDDPYERPLSADLTVDAAACAPDTLLERVLEGLRARRLPAPEGSSRATDVSARDGFPAGRLVGRERAT
jgi:sulfate adenylyltransferase